LSTLYDVALTFFTALGVVVGGSVIGSLATVVSPDSPVHTMLVIAKPIKLWAMVVALGGTFPPSRHWTRAYGRASSAFSCSTWP